MSRAETIDGSRFAAEGGVVTGTLGIEHLPRLVEMGCEGAMLQYAVRGGQDAERRATLTVETIGKLRVVCQRCLGQVELPLDLTSTLELAGTQTEIDTADDERDRVLAAPAMDIAALVEDEAILALPMAPVHRRCETDDVAVSGTPQSPFASLAALRKPSPGPGGPDRKTNA